MAPTSDCGRSSRWPGFGSGPSDRHSRQRQRHSREWLAESWNPLCNSGWQWVPALRAQVLQPVSQELRCQSAEISREQRKAVGDQQNAQHDEHPARNPVHPYDVWSEALKPDQKPVQGQRGQEERQREAQCVNREQQGPPRQPRLRRRESEDAAEYRSDARRPRRAEREPDDAGTEVAQRLACQLDAPFAHEERGTQNPQQIDPKQNQEYAAHAPQPYLIVAQ